MNSEDSAASTSRSPNVLVEPLSSLTINEKPTPKPRPNRRQIGFYTSLCSDIVESEKDSQSSGKAKKKPKKEKSLRGSKYYASLADDIAAMKLGQPDQSQKERKEMKRRNPSRKNEMPAHELAKKQNMDEGVEQVERDLSGVSHSDEEPPKWFEKVVDKVSLVQECFKFSFRTCYCMYIADFKENDHPSVIYMTKYRSMQTTKLE